jgi:hypothetical protein
MIGNTMLKKRLRVFTNIASENENETHNRCSSIKNFERSEEKLFFPQLNFDSFLRCSIAHSFPVMKVIKTNFYIKLKGKNRVNPKKQANIQPSGP